MANRSLICSPGRVSRGGMCAASTTSGAPAAEIVVRAMPAMMPAAIPAAPPASDRMVGRRMGFLLVEIGLDGTGPTRTRGKRLCNRTANSSYSRTRKGDSPEMVVDERLQALLDQGEEMGCLNLSAVSEFLQEADLDEDQTTGFFEQLDERGIALTDDCARPDAQEAAYVNRSEERRV